MLSMSTSCRTGGSTIHLDVRRREDTMDGENRRRARSSVSTHESPFHGVQGYGSGLGTSTAGRIFTSCRSGTRRRACDSRSGATGWHGRALTVGYVADWQPDRARAVPVQRFAGLADAVSDLPRRTRWGVRVWRQPLESGPGATMTDWTATKFEPDIPRGERAS